MAVLRSRTAETLAHLARFEATLYTFQKRWVRHTWHMRRRAFVIVALLLVLGLGAGVGLYLGSRHPNGSSVAGTTTTPRRQKPPKPVGPHNRPVPILMYHLVGPMPPGAPYPELYVSRPDFVGQLRWLARAGYRAVTLDSVYRYWRGRERLPARPIVLSFDDGYR